FVHPVYYLSFVLFRLFFSFFFFIVHQPSFSLFPYTTLFRSLFTLWRGPTPATRAFAAHAARRWFHRLSVFTLFTLRRGPTKVNKNRKSRRLNSSHGSISYAFFCL